MRRFILPALVVAILASAVSPIIARASVLTKIAITPSTSTVTTDQTLALSVTATDQSGVPSDVSAQAIYSTDDPTGSVVGNVYHPGHVGTWSIQANVQSLAATMTVTVTSGAVSFLDINPNSKPETISLGETRAFRINAFDRNNNSVSTPAIAWTVTPAIGTVSTGGVFTPSGLGVGTITATAGAITTSVTIHIIAAPKIVSHATASSSSASTTSHVNQNTNTVTTTNTNANRNTNTAAVNAKPVTNTNTVTTTPKVKSCTTISPLWWTLILIAWAVLLIILFAMFPLSAIWPGAIALIGGAALVVLQVKTGCHQLAWWPWTTGIVTIALSILSIRPNTGTQTS